MNVLIFFTSAFYLLATCAALHYLISRNSSSRLPLFASAVLSLGCHAALLAERFAVHHQSGLSMLNMALLVSLIMSVFVTLIASRFRGWLLLPVAYGFALILVIAHALAPLTPTFVLILKPVTIAHLVSSLFAYALLMVAALLALQQWYLNYRLKHHQPDLMQFAPALITSEQRLLSLVILGQVVLTISIGLGLFFLNTAAHVQHASKIFFSLGAWGIYSVLVLGHFQYGWRGRHIVWLSVAGAVTLTFAYFGSHLFGQGR